MQHDSESEQQYFNDVDEYFLNLPQKCWEQKRIYYQELQISTLKNGSNSMIYMKLNNQNQELIIMLQSIEHIKNYIDFQLIVLLILKN
ncbi:unnamed protein product [Paramecium pentaurelia]|uniref:Uncharacterized protein n=1 Tax=Paramecium pentaurelia TaxID=43138 RepID=A0A8S1TAJ3_9CILI|nr:unnamed protein product [Paramecium pentaurelia]